ncbi:hypothetical protein BGX30_011076 [Mortierella sp. GBA39]|nr:hypothetical protein BGX30_011076 [Mortierella sp. GBA39]
MELHGFVYRVSYRYQHNHTLGSLTDLDTRQNSADIKATIRHLILQGSTIQRVMQQLTIGYDKFAQILRGDGQRLSWDDFITISFNRWVVVILTPSSRASSTRTASTCLDSAKCDFPTSTLTPGYIYFTEPSLKDVFYANALSSDYTGYNNAHFSTSRGSLIEVLFGHHGHSNKNMSIVSDARRTHYKFKGTIQTSGLRQHQQHQHSISDDLDADVSDTMDDDFELLDIEDEAEETGMDSLDHRIQSAPECAANVLTPRRLFGSRGRIRDWLGPWRKECWCHVRIGSQISRQAAHTEDHKGPICGDLPCDFDETPRRQGVNGEGKPVLDQDGNVATRVVYGSRKNETLQRPVVICIGLAQFNSRTGLPWKHAKLIRRFVQL